MQCHVQVIDEVHYKNHTDAHCLSRYIPVIAKEKHPNANFVVVKHFMCNAKESSRFICIDYALGGIGTQKNVIN